MDPQEEAANMMEDIINQRSNVAQLDSSKDPNSYLNLDGGGTTNTSADAANVNEITSIHHFFNKIYTLHYFYWFSMFNFYYLAKLGSGKVHKPRGPTSTKNFKSQMIVNKIVPDREPRDPEKTSTKMAHYCGFLIR